MQKLLSYTVANIVTQEEILNQQRLERFYRKNPGLKYPVELPVDVLQEFEAGGVSKQPISFIVPFKGKERLLHLNKCINNLLLRYPFCEIIIVEDSVDRVINFLIPGTKYINTHNSRHFNKPLCFNLGFLVASNDIVCGIDCDMIIPSTLIDLNIEFINQNKVVFPGKDIYYTVPDIQIEDLKSQKIWNHKTWLKDRSTEQFHGGIFITNKTAYATVGGFDHRFEGYGSEDTNFYTRCTESNNAFTTRNINLLHIEHSHNDIDLNTIEINKRLLFIYSKINVNDRIKDCRDNNIFSTK